MTVGNFMGSLESVNKKRSFYDAILLFNPASLPIGRDVAGFSHFAEVEFKKTAGF